MIKEVKILEVHVDKGMKHGQRITFTGEADQAPGVEPGDIVLLLQEKEHEVISFLFSFCLRRSEMGLVCKIQVGGGFVAKLCPILVTPWTVVPQASLSMGFSRQEYWSGLPFPSLGDLPNPGIQPGSSVLWADSLPTEL